MIIIIMDILHSTAIEQDRQSGAKPCLAGGYGNCSIVIFICERRIINHEKKS
jgi:hypothetical protein